MVTAKPLSIETPDQAFILVLHDLVVSTFEFGGNRRFFEVDTANFVGCRGGTRAIPLLVVSHIPVAYVIQFPQYSGHTISRWTADL